jgi:hypothetical protein
MSTLEAATLEAALGMEAISVLVVCGSDGSSQARTRKIL